MQVSVIPYSVYQVNTRAHCLIPVSFETFGIAYNIYIICNIVVCSMIFICLFCLLADIFILFKTINTRQQWCSIHQLNNTV